MEDGDGDMDLETNSVQNLSSDTYLYLSKKENESGKRRRVQEYKLKGLERAQAVSENGGPWGFGQGHFMLPCVHDNSTKGFLGVGFCFLNISSASVTGVFQLDNRNSRKTVPYIVSTAYFFTRQFISISVTFFPEDT